MAAILNSIGLVFDIVGVWLVAYEVVKKFKGNELMGWDASFLGATPPSKKTPEFKSWEKKKHHDEMGAWDLNIRFYMPDYQ